MMEFDIIGKTTHRKLSVSQLELFVKVTRYYYCCNLDCMDGSHRFFMRLYTVILLVTSRPSWSRDTV
jgi:hypothetical protein